VEITSEQSASDQLQGSLRKYVPLAIVAIVVVVHLLIAARSVGPMYVFDEIGYLANANVIAGHSADWSLCGSSYAVGYSAVLAPLWWLPIEPVTIYQIAAFISAALGALAIWPATLLARRFGAGPNVSLAIGALVTLVPARALMSNYVLAENPLTLLILVATLLALRLAQRGRTVDHVLLGAVAGLAAAVHARALPLVAVTIAWLVARAVLGRSKWAAAALTIAPAAILSLVSLWAQSAIGGQVFADDTRVEDLVGHLSLLRIGEVVLGQAFVQVVSWALLTVLGLLACISRARATVRRDGVPGVASAWWWLGGMVLAQAVFFVWVLAGSADYATRFDTPIFGRYLDPFVVPIAVLGATALWVRASARLTNAALIASIVAVLGYGLLVLPRVAIDAVWIPFAVPGLVPFLDVLSLDDRPGLGVAGIVGLLFAVLMWLSQGRARVGLVCTLIAASALSVGADWLRIDPLEEGSRAESVTGAFVLANPDIPATFAADILPCLERNKIQFETAGHVAIVPHGGDYGKGIAVGPKDWPLIERYGFQKEFFTTFEDAAAWVHQG
jgi:hypothetical protein